MQSKKELIEAINGIREEIGMEQYNYQDLDKKSVEELNKIYTRHESMREEYMDGHKPGFERRFLLLIPASIIVAAVLYLVFVQGVFNPGPRIYHYEYSINLVYVNGNDGIFSLTNKGDNITSMNVIVDNYNRDYQLEKGSFPLEKSKTLYFKIWSVCDGNVHLVETKAHGTTSNYTVTGCSDLPRI
jgi:hypothetical protein